jgi:hypothetical protein
MDDKSQISNDYHTFSKIYDSRQVCNNAMLVNECVKKGLFNIHKSWKNKDGKECFGGGWFVVQMDLPTGQMSNYYEAKYWNEFQCEEREVPDAWDGRTLERMIQFLNP